MELTMPKSILKRRSHSEPRQKSPLQQESGSQQGLPPQNATFPDRKYVNYAFHIFPYFTGPSVKVNAIALTRDPTQNPVDNVRSKEFFVLIEGSFEARLANWFLRFIQNLDIAPKVFELASITVVHKGVKFEDWKLLDEIKKLLGEQDKRKIDDNVKIDVQEECQLYKNIYLLEKESYELKIIRMEPYSYIWSNHVTDGHLDDGTIVVKVEPRRCIPFLRKKTVRKQRPRRGAMNDLGHCSKLKKRFYRVFGESIKKVHDLWNEEDARDELKRLVVLVIGDTAHGDGLQECEELRALRNDHEKYPGFKISWVTQVAKESKLPRTVFSAAAYGWNSFATKETDMYTFEKSVSEITC